MSGATFLDVAQDLIHDAGAKAAFDADPDGFLAERGFGDLSAADVGDAVRLVADTLPAGAARGLAGADAAPDGSDALVRLARLDPAELDVGSEAESQGLLLDHDPSGELDLLADPADSPLDVAPDPPAERGQEDPMTDTGDHELHDLDHGPAAEDAGEAHFDRLDQTEPEPGFGVGWEPGDADDVTAASPEFANVLDHPADLDLDVTHVADLTFGAADPISEAIAWADHDEYASHDPAPIEDDHDAGDDGHHHPGDDADHDGHIDL